MRPASTKGKPFFLRPIFAVQANFVDDGLFLAFSMQHALLDEVWQSRIINEFVQCLHLRENTLSELKVDAVHFRPKALEDSISSTRSKRCRFPSR